MRFFHWNVSRSIHSSVLWVIRSARSFENVWIGFPLKRQFLRAVLLQIKSNHKRALKTPISWLQSIYHHSTGTENMFVTLKSFIDLSNLIYGQVSDILFHYIFRFSWSVDRHIALQWLNICDDALWRRFWVIPQILAEFSISTIIRIRLVFIFCGRFVRSVTNDMLIICAKQFFSEVDWIKNQWP